MSPNTNIEGTTSNNSNNNDGTLGNNLESNESQDESLIDRSLRYLNSGKYSDLTLIIEKKEIKVHKMILIMSSPYFETLLAKNPDLNQVKIDCVQYDEFWVFLKVSY